MKDVASRPKKDARKSWNEQNSRGEFQFFGLTGGHESVR